MGDNIYRRTASDRILIRPLTEVPHMRSIRSTLPSVLAAAALVLALATPVSAAAAGPGPISTATASPPAATTFTTPLKAKSYTVSSYYGPRCMSIPGASTFHLGLDMAAPGGSRSTPSRPGSWSPRSTARVRGPATSRSGTRWAG
ncbi:hypothetical protein [Microbacterium elymi]|uniref:Uncharacterized protein n=1 Tax=Microbacterium elymi TaxID=2909587 RepID=A0ABY5NIU3_9MICO|nr:hypothetical protein [Microbacterium elymi]UUT35073.1 hypothetical protein L2X98_32795 [Microbacterium elymi]